MSRVRLSSRTLGAVVLAALGLLCVLVFSGKLGFQTFQGADTRDVTARFSKAGQLRKGMVVFVDGIRSGQIKQIDFQPEGRSADVTMEVEHDAGPLYASARASLRWKTVLGGAFFVDLDRGRPSTGVLRGPIPATQTTTQVELDDLLTINQGASRQGLRRLPRALSDALKDKSLVGAVDRLDEAAPSLRDGLDGLRGQGDRDLQDLVTQAAATIRKLDTPTDKARALIQGAAVTLKTTGARTADIRAALTVAPGAFAQVRSTLPQLENTLALARPVLANLDDAAPSVAPTLFALRPTLRGADRLLARAEPLLAYLRPAVRSLGRTSVTARDFLLGVRPGLDDLDKKVLPILNEKDSVTGRTTAQMIGPTFAALGPGMSGQEDQNGHFVRFPATAGSSPFYLPCQTYINNPDKAALIQCQAVSKTITQLLNPPLDGKAPGTDGPAPGSKRRKR